MIPGYIMQGGGVALELYYPAACCIDAGIAGDTDLWVDAALSFRENLLVQEAGIGI